MNSLVKVTPSSALRLWVARAGWAKQREGLNYPCQNRGLRGSRRPIRVTYAYAKPLAMGELDEEEKIDETEAATDRPGYAYAGTASAVGSRCRGGGQATA